MMVILEKYGQLCNNLWSYLPFIIKAIKEKRKVYIFGFDNYCKYFEDLNSYPYVKFVRAFLIPQKFMSSYFVLLSVFSQILFKIPYLNRCVCKIDLQSCPLINATTEEHDILKQIFRPKITNIHVIEEILKREKRNRIIVGVHIRRGDYKTYNNGIWYYDDEAYSSIMSQAQGLFSSTEMSFVICSNENVELENFHFNVLSIGRLNLIQDLYLLSLCDYIIGPHSTYSMWASFLGKVPLYIMYDRNKKLTLSEFKVITHLE